MEMEESILTSTKKLLGVAVDDESFDLDIAIHINSAISGLSQLGISIPGGFGLDSNDLAVTTWQDFDIGGMGFGDDTMPILSQLKTYVYLYVRRLFDPPTTSYLVDALNKQIEQLEWRINTMREATGWVDPDPPEVVVTDV